MLFRHEPEVLVVGAGPVGLMTALALSERGVAVEVIDEEAEPGLHNYALTLHPATLALLDDVGLAAELLDRGLRIGTLSFFDVDGAGPRAEIAYGELRTEFPHLLTLPRSALEAALERRLRERKVPVRWKHRLKDFAPVGDHVGVTVEELGVDSGGYVADGPLFVVERVKEIKPRILIGADGFHSVVRRRAHIGFDAMGPPEAFAAVEFEAPEAGITGVRVAFSAETTTALWPLPGGRYRFQVQLLGDDQPPRNSPLVHIGQRAYPRVPIGRVDALVRERAPWFAPRVPQDAWAAEVHFDVSLAQRFGQDRTWLVGDAAHVTGPVGVHSMNEGLLEARMLASRVARVLREREAPWGLLDRYHAERTAVWRQLLGESHPPVPSAGCNPWVARHAARILRCLPASGADLPALAAQIGLEVPAPL